MTNIFHAWCGYNNPPIIDSFYYCPFSRARDPPGVHLSTNFFVWPAYLRLDTLSHYLGFVSFQNVSRSHSLLPDPYVAHFRGHYCYKSTLLMIQIRQNHGLQTFLYSSKITDRGEKVVKYLNLQSKKLDSEMQ